MKNLSTCHNHNIIRTRFSKKTVCGFCGKYETMIKTRLIQEEKEIIQDKGFLEDKKKFVTLILPDTRDFIRHLKVTGKYTACGVRGFRTNDKKRINCKNCLKSKDYLGT